MKIFAKIGVTMSILCVAAFALFAISFLWMDDTLAQGMGWFFVAFVWIVGGGSLLCYFVDAILSIVKICKKIDPIFNAALVLTILGLLVFFTLDLGWLCLVDYLAIFLLEWVSLAREKA